MADESPVFMFDGSDSEMGQASQKARETFRYFWREMAWERRRIVPALEVAVVKAAFTDDPGTIPTGTEVECEHMWIHEIDFDGDDVSGVLGNSPNGLKSISEGDHVTIPLTQVSDWMYAIRGRAYGAYTVNLMRSRMSRSECAGHDEAWGLDFGNPTEIALVPDDFAGSVPSGFLKRLFGRKPTINAATLSELEHPMSEAMGDSMREFLSENPEQVSHADENGWTMLHHQALAGSAASIQILLELGADRSVKTNRNKTALMLAEKLGWTKVADLLK
tara:strand:+ start:131886 stop:132713 length:828 start_codon:yes stop_codon:yes gene_type:complete